MESTLCQFHNSMLLRECMRHPSWLVCTLQVEACLEQAVCFCLTNELPEA